MYTAVHSSVITVLVAQSRNVLKHTRWASTLCKTVSTIHKAAFNLSLVLPVLIGDMCHIKVKKLSL